MEVLELRGKKYVKASSIARELGYTSDYVGQLCRAEKVDAQLVGRSWYVQEDSIRNHKSTRYRSSKAKTAHSLKSSIAEMQQDAGKADAHSVPVKIKQGHFYARNTPKEAKYTEDRSELIPRLTERHSDGRYSEVEVRHADEKLLSVKKTKSQGYTLKPTARPKIRFTGNVTIIEPDTGEQATKKGNKGSRAVTEHVEVHETKPIVSPVQLRIEKSDRDSRKGCKISVSQHTNNETEVVQLKNSVSVSMRRSHATKPQSGLGELAVTNVTDENGRTGRATFVYISLSLLVAILFAGSLLFLESSVTVTADSSSSDSGYRFNISSAIESFRK